MADTLACDFCAHGCLIAEGGVGLCRARGVVDGRLVTLVRDEICALALDPVEKKPLFHFLPGSLTWSVALGGCNLHCDFCQNHLIAQLPKIHRPRMGGERTMTPQSFVESFIDQQVPSASFTYTEPTVWQDWMLECSAGVHQAGGLCCMVSNGYFSEAALSRFQGQIDAYNIDLKGSDDFYHRYCGGRLGAVKTAIATLAALEPVPPTGSPGSLAPVLEVTTMVIEGIHSLRDIEEMGGFLADAGVQVWHLSRFFPHWRMMDRPPCSEDYLERLLSLARGLGIPHVYGGNSQNCGNTLCPGCQTVVLDRSTRGPRLNEADDLGDCPDHTGSQGTCSRCGRKIYGRFQGFGSSRLTPLSKEA